MFSPHERNGDDHFAVFFEMDSGVKHEQVGIGNVLQDLKSGDRIVNLRAFPFGEVGLNIGSGLEIKRGDSALLFQHFIQIRLGSGSYVENISISGESDEFASLLFEQPGEEKVMRSGLQATKPLST